MGAEAAGEDHEAQLMNPWLFTVAFLAGILDEVLAVLWTACSQANFLPGLMLCSVLQGAARLSAVGAFMTDRQYAGPVLAGYAAGAYPALWLKRRLALWLTRRLGRVVAL